MQLARVAANQLLCREHFRLTMRVESLAPSVPGQFVHLCPAIDTDDAYRTHEWGDSTAQRWQAPSNALPMLRRAFSIAGRRETKNGTEVDIIYRVVGRCTQWLASLREGDGLSLLGPLGNAFPIARTKKVAWMVAGGVGLPPMLYLAEALRAAGRDVVAFCGAQSRDLLPFGLIDSVAPSADASKALACIEEFARWGARAVVSTDDGSLGFRGHIGAALAAYVAANPQDASDVVVYTCGPERMMRFVAEFCLARSIECYVCMERAMACGTGMCQSCVVPVHDDEAESGWRYRLCCTEGPVFSAPEIIWDPVAV